LLLCVTDKEVAEGTFKRDKVLSIFGEVNISQLLAYRPSTSEVFLATS